ncbi:hypothetical protein ACWDYJ_08990 [Streptomyces sp. NPDC003042]
MTAGTPAVPPTTAVRAYAAPPRTVRRLRPGVAVTPLRNGLHLRGRRGSVTLEGSAALPALWRLLEAPLRDGGLEVLRDGMEPGSSLRAAVDTLVGQLDAHDLLVTEPEERARPADPVDHGRTAGSGPVAQWIGVTAERPDAAATALATTRAEVLAGAPDGPLARAAGRALERCGLPVSYTADTALPADRVLLYARGDGPDRGVAVGLCGDGGYATAPGGPAQVRSDAAALEARLGSGEAAGSAALVTLLGGAAAHRLLCAAAGMPDPASEGDDERLLSGLPAVLFARARPLHAEYRTWLGPDRLDADRRADLAPAGTLGEALRRVAALGDERCGILPEPLPADLRQLPAPLAACRLPETAPPGGSLVCAAPRLDLARLEMFCRGAELLSGEEHFTVGATPGHARGRALRAAASSRFAPSDGYASVTAARWSGHPQARHWWTTLTVRLAVPARLEVFRAAPGEEVYRALVRRSAPGGGDPLRTPSEPPVLGDAVEATPGDAVALAALSAVCAVSVGLPAGRTRPSGGAVAPLATAGTRTAAWEDSGWTGRWLADMAVREDAFQDALRRLTGAAFHSRAPGPARARELTERLRTFGFTVLHPVPHTPQEAR